MKKAIVLILIAIVAVSSAFAFKFLSVGIETGFGFHASGDMEIIDNLDIYARLGYTGFFDMSFGAQYKVTEFKVGSTAIALKPGAQFDFDFGDDYFSFMFLVTCGFSVDISNFTAFARPGLGLSTYPSYQYNYNTLTMEKKTKAAFAFLIETGIAYKF